MPVQRLAQAQSRKRLQICGDGEILLVLDPCITKDNEDIPDRPLAPKHASMGTPTVVEPAAAGEKLADSAWQTPIVMITSYSNSVYVTDKSRTKWESINLYPTSRAPDQNSSQLSTRRATSAIDQSRVSIPAAIAGITRSVL
jgi:hypothetical protein